MNAPAYMSCQASDLAMKAAAGHPREVDCVCSRLQAIEGAVFLGANACGRLDDDLFALYSERFA